MNINLLLLDSCYNMESLISYAFSFSEITRRKLKIVYVYDFEWMMNSYTVGSASVADPVFAHIQTTARNEYIEAEPKDLSFGEKSKWKGFMEMAREMTGIQTLLPVLKSEKKILRAIENYVEEAHPDLLVVLKEKKGFFEEIFSKSETKKVLTHFSIPILVYHEK